MSNTERTGRWSMPRQLEVRALMSSIVLDLREVSIHGGVCEIDLFAVMASVEILVPPGVVVVLELGTDEPSITARPSGVK